jgi:hypothetical protein
MTGLYMRGLGVPDPIPTPSDPSNPLVLSVVAAS